MFNIVFQLWYRCHYHSQCIYYLSWEFSGRILYATLEYIYACKESFQDSWASESVRKSEQSRSVSSSHTPFFFWPRNRLSSIDVQCSCGSRERTCLVSCSSVLVISRRDSPGIHFETVLQSNTKRTLREYRQDEDAQFKLQKDLDRVHNFVPIRSDIRIHYVPQDPANGIAEGEWEQGGTVVDVVFCKSMSFPSNPCWRPRRRFATCGPRFRSHWTSRYISLMWRIQMKLPKVESPLCRKWGPTSSSEYYRFVSKDRMILKSKVTFRRLFLLFNFILIESLKRNSCFEK